MVTLKIIKNGRNEKNPKAIVSGESTKSGESKGGTLKKDGKRGGSFRDKLVPKKACAEKLCDLCKKHG